MTKKKNKQLNRWFKGIDRFLILSFLLGLIPASFIIHIIQKDFSGFYFLAISYLKYHEHAYQILTNYCDNPINSGLNARAPLVPFLMAISFGIFGRTLFGLYLPFFLARILILPFTYLLAKFYLPKRIAFLASLLLVLVPKLQTYSFGSPEADIFVALFYVAAMYFYKKCLMTNPQNSSRLKKRGLAFFSGASLGLGALAKSTGFAIGVGMLIAIFIDQFLSHYARKRKSSSAKKMLKFTEQWLNIFIIVITFFLFIGPYLAWTLIVHKQLYLVTQHDRSVLYILDNLPSLLYTLPLYLGLNFQLGLKGTLVSIVILFMLILGITSVMRHRDSILVLPTLVTLILISSLSTCLIGGNIPYSYEFVTILGFAMIPVAILTFIGAFKIVSFIGKKIFMGNIPSVVMALAMLLLMVKFTNNFFSVPYALDFIPDEYYISLPTVIKYREELPDVEYESVGKFRIFKGPIIHQELRKMLRPYEFKPFSPFYKKLILSAIGFSIFIYLLPVRQEKRH